MTITLTDPGSGGLFDIVGKACYAISTLNTARGTTVPTEVEDFLEEWEGLSGADLDYQTIIERMAKATTAWQGAGNSLASSIRTACQSLLIEMVATDADQPDRTLTRALQYLIDQMDASGSYVDPNVVGLTLAQDSGDDNDVVICYTTRRGDGRTQENMLAEAVDIEVIAESSSTPSLRFLGEAVEGNKLSYNWPQGSGCNRTVAATSAASSLLTNGDFEDETDSGIPDGWTVAEGTPDETVALSDPEIQTVVIAGSPTSGTYNLRWTNADGITRTTANLAYNASSSAVQTALRTLPGLELLTVSSSGTSPNFTHTVTFTGTAGALSQLTSVNNLDNAATITHETTRDGDNGAFKGKSLQIISTGNGEETTLYTPLSGLAAETVYVCHFRIKRLTPPEESSSSHSESSQSSSSNSSTSSASTTESTSSTAAGAESSSSSASESSSSGSSLSVSSSTEDEETSQSTSSSNSSTEASNTSSSSPSASSSSSETGHELRVEIVDGIGGSRTVDAEGYDNEIRIDLDHLGDDHQSKWFSFRLQKTTASPVYLRVRVLDQLAAGERVYLDEMAIVQATELYAGGPYVAAFSGINDATLGDGWTLTSTNSRAGSFQEWYNRLYDMAAKGLLLPSSGTVNVPDSLIG